MKKYLLALAFFGVCLGVARADSEWAAPKNQQGMPFMIPGWAGVSYATSAFSVNLATVTLSSNTVFGPTTVFGVDFSSGLCGSYDYVEVFDSSSSERALNGPTGVFRWYNTAGSTNTGNSGNWACSGFSGPPMPINFTKGVFFRPSSANYNSIRLYYWKNGQ